MNNNLTMLKIQNQSKFIESNYHEQIPFFRQAITIIDECTKLMKQDRIYLRNKIKEYLKDLRSNKDKQDQWQNELIQQLIHVFVEANKKKSLGKIQKNDKVMDWIQIKLRKLIDGSKKEKHRRDLENFKKNKVPTSKKHQESQHYNDKSLEKSRQLHQYPVKNTDHLNKMGRQFQTKSKISQNKYNFNKSVDKSPASSSRIRSQNQQFSSHSFYKQFQYLKKNERKDNNSSSALKNRIENQYQRYNNNLSAKSNNRSLDSKFQFEKTFSKNISRPKTNQQYTQNVITNPKQNYLFQQKPHKKDEQTRKQLNKLTQLFTYHLNSSNQKKLHQQKQQKYSYKNHEPFNNDENFTQQATFGTIPGSTSSRYQASTNKINQMLQNSKSLLNDYNNNHPQIHINHQPQFIYPEIASSNVNHEDLFTPPDLLAECRKFLFSSHKKEKTEEDLQITEKNDKIQDYNRPLTFSGILSASNEKNLEKITKLNQFGINQVTSQNVSANLSTKKPDSEVYFQFKNILITTFQGLLLQIFKYSQRSYYDRLQIGEIMSKCNPQVQKSLQNYCDLLIDRSKINDKICFDFNNFVKYLYGEGKILQDNKEYFCRFLRDILDIRKKGYIDEDDIDSFFQSLQNSQLDISILGEIKDLLGRLFQKGRKMDGGNILTHWTIFYFELKGDRDFNQLKDHLNKFQFQLDQTEQDD